MKERKEKKNQEKKAGAVGKQPNAFVTFFSLLRGGRLILAGAVVASLLSVLLGYLLPQFVMFTVDNILGTEEMGALLTKIVDAAGGLEFLRANFYLIPLAVGAIALLTLAIGFLQRLFTLNAAEKIVKGIRDRVFTHIQDLPYAWHSGIQTGDIIQRATQDSDLIKRFASAQLLDLFRVVFMMAAGLYFMFSMHVGLTLVVLAFIPVLLAFSAVFFAKISKNFKTADELEGAVTAKLQENLTGVRVVRAFGRQAYETEGFEKKNTEFVAIWRRLGKYMSVYWATGDIFAGLQVLTIMIAGAVLAASGELTAGAVLAFIFYNTYMIWPIRNAGRILAEMGKVRIACNRLGEVLTAETETEPQNAVLPEIKGGIEFRNVSFGYAPEKLTVEDLSFSIPAGATLGIVGGTGSGKSTVVHLINRLYDPTAGEILIDGVNIAQIPRAHLRRNVGLILQEPFLFGKSVTDNIAIAAEGASADDIQRYAEIACVDEAIAEFKDGYDTVLGERGVTVSGGQKQRIAIARTLIQKPPIVIFDDSLSAVDTETDFKIRQAIAKNLKGTTVILISHRISTLMHADLILVLNNGRIEQSGTHRELAKREGIYKRVFDMQTAAEAGEGL